MRSRRLVLLATIAASIAATVALLPRIAERAAMDFIERNINGTVSWSGWSFIGNGVRLIDPKVTADGETVFSAASVDLFFSPRIRDFEITGVRLEKPVIRIGAGSAGLFKKTEPDGKFALELDASSARLIFDSAQFDLPHVEAALSMSGGRTSCVLASATWRSPLGEVHASGTLSAAESTLDAADLKLEYRGAAAALTYDGAWNIAFRDVAPAFLNDVIPALSARMRNDEIASWLARAGGFERCGALEARWDGQTLSGAVANLAFGALPIEIASARFTYARGRALLDSATLFVSLDGDSGMFLAEEGEVRGGVAALKRLIGEGRGFSVVAGDLRLENGEIAAEIDSFAARIENAALAGKGKITGAFADPDFEGVVAVSGMRIKELGAAFTADVVVEKLLSERASDIRLHEGHLRWRDMNVVTGPSRVKLTRSAVELVSPLALHGKNVSGVVSGAAAFNSSLAELVRTLTYNVELSDFDLGMLGFAGARAETVSIEGARMNPTRLAAEHLTAPQFSAEAVEVVDSGALLDAARGMTVIGKEIRAAGIRVHAGRIMISGDETIRSLDAAGRIGEEGAEFTARLSDSSAKFELGGAELSGAFAMKLAGDELRFEGTQTTRNGGRIEVRGAMGRDGIAARGRSEGKLSELLELLRGTDSDIRTTSGDFVMEFDLGDSSSANISLRDGGVIFGHGIELSDVACDATYVSAAGSEEGTWSIGRMSGRSAAGEFRMSGTVIAHRGGFEDAVLDVTWVSSNFELSALEKIHPAFLGMRGTADAELRIVGTLSDPRLSGFVAIENGSRNIKGLGFADKLTGRVEFSRDTIQVVSLSGSLGGGTIRSSGMLLMDDGHVVGKISGGIERALVRPGNGIEGTISGDFDIFFGEGLPILSSRLSASNARLIFNEFESVDNRVDLAEKPVLRLDIVLAVPELKITSADLDMRVGSEALRITGTDLSPSVTGTLEGTTGRLVTRQATFRIRRAVIVIPDEGEISISAQSVARVGRTKIFADVSGPVSNRKISLSSEPSKSEEELVRILAFGRDDITGIEPGSFQSGMARNVVLPISGGMRGDLGGGIGIESVRFEKSGSDTGTELFDRVTIGAYLSDKMYLGYSQPTDVAGERSIEIEYELKPELFLKFETGDRGTTGAGFEWRKDY